MEPDLKTVRKKRNNHGQALLEMLITSIVIISISSIFLALCAFLIIHFQIKYEMQKSLICLTSQSSTICENKMRSSLSNGFSIGKIKNLNLIKNKKELSILLIYQFKNLNFDRKYFQKALR